jgi:hypothetical protein
MLQPILQSVVDTAARLCRAEQSMIYRLEGGVYRFAAAASGQLIPPAYLEIGPAPRRTRAAGSGGEAFPILTGHRAVGSPYPGGVAGQVGDPP